MLAPTDFFDLSAALHAEAFEDTEYVWDVLKTLGNYVKEMLAEKFPAGISPNAIVYPTSIVNDAQVHVGKGAVIMPHAYVEGPAIIGAGATVGQGAYIRSGVVLSPGALVGHASEAKNALLLENAHAPHFAYVGDSVLGARVNLGAGTKLSNLGMNSVKDPDTGKRPTIILTINGETYDTGLAKMGAIIGDDSQTGCNTVTNPGTLIGARTLVYALASLSKGYYPADSVIKVRQVQEIVEKRT